MSAYPGSLDAAEATQKLKAFLSAGNAQLYITFIINDSKALPPTCACNKTVN